jgi:mono/diheme cytochrome c family protein
VRPRPAVTFAVALTCVAASACLKSRERERVDFERMRIQQRYEPYGRSAAFANGAAMQTPPAGTVARETAQDTGVAGTGMSGGQYAASLPSVMSDSDLALGHEKFDVYCAVCHGAGGFGGSIVAENMGQPRPPSLRSAAVIARPAGYLFDVATRGKGRMPAYAPQLTSRERWDVVAYLRRLQHSTVTTEDQRADSVRAVVIRGIDSALARQHKS